LLQCTVCEYAANNRDGTFTVLRGGMSFWEGVPGFDVSFFVFGEAPPNSLAPGRNPLSVEVTVDSTGVKLAEMNGELVVNDPRQVSRVVVHASFRMVVTGACTVRMKLGALQAEVPFESKLPVPAPLLDPPRAS
jgi:hypothetical protein